MTRMQGAATCRPQECIWKEHIRILSFLSCLRAAPIAGRLDSHSALPRGAGLNGHQGLKPTDVVGPPHSPQVKMASSLKPSSHYSEFGIFLSVSRASTFSLMPRFFAHSIIYSTSNLDACTAIIPCASRICLSDGIR